MEGWWKGLVRLGGGWKEEVWEQPISVSGEVEVPCSQSGGRKDGRTEFSLARYSALQESSRFWASKKEVKVASGKKKKKSLKEALQSR